jgi:hypothetical protein
VYSTTFLPFLSESSTHIFAKFAFLTHIFAEVADLCVKRQLGLLAGNVLTYVAATTAAMTTGFWDRRCHPTCGRLRRVLLRVDFSEVPVPEGPLRKKASVTAHLPKGVQGHRRRLGVLTLLANSLRRRKAA